MPTPFTALALVVLADAALDEQQQQMLAAAEAMLAPGAKNPDSSRLTFGDLERKCGFTVPLKLDPSLVPVAQKLASKPGREADLIWTNCLSMAEAVMYSCEDPELKEGLRARVKGLRCQATADGEAHGKYELTDGTLVMTFGAKPARDMDTLLGRGREFLKKNARPAPKALGPGRR